MFPKVKIMAATTKRTMLGGSLPFKEGEDWSKNRKILNKVFNFDLVKEMIPTICKTCDKAIDLFEQKASKLEDGKFEGFVHELIRSAMTMGIAECLLGCDADTMLDGEPLANFLVKYGKIAGKQTQDPFCIMLGEKFLNLNITKTNKLVNHYIFLMR